MKLTKDHYFAGRKTRKQLEKQAKNEAKGLIAGTIGSGTADLSDARSMMETYYWMKPRHIDSVIIHKQLMKGWVVLLTFKDLPRGIPNVLGAPGKPKSEEEARSEAMRLLRAAFVKCEDTKVLMRNGLMSDIRLFRYQGIDLQVPGEMVDAAARKIPEQPGRNDVQKLRQKELDTIHSALGQRAMTVDDWNMLSEDHQLQVMMSASNLLCLNINQAA